LPDQAMLSFNFGEATKGASGNDEAQPPASRYFHLQYRGMNVIDDSAGTRTAHNPNRD
jgi:hypothetical protein